MMRPASTVRVGLISQSLPDCQASEILAERWTAMILRNLHLGCETFIEIVH